MKKIILNGILKLLMFYARNHIYFHLEGYMNRYWLIPYKSNRWGFGIRIHEILRGDLDRCLHDHPWTFISVILKGSYTEVTEDWDGSNRKEFDYKEGSIRIRKATDFHKLILKTDNSCWTLFITFKKVQSWGFKVWNEKTNQYEKVYWRDYLNEYDPIPSSENY